MGGHLIGLDIGTHAVTAAELSLGRKPTLHRFGQVALPPGAMNAGDVVDPAAVTDALKRLWREGGFRSRQVVLGLGNHKVIVRQTEMPDLPHEEMRAAITFQARELIPIPIDEARFDVKVLAAVAPAPTYDSDDEHGGGVAVAVETEQRMRVMIAAAPRDMVHGLLTVVEAAGLQPMAVNLVPLALIKALGDTTWIDPADYQGAGTAEAIVAVGAGTTNIVIHEGGVPSFVRILDQGGNSLTRAIADELHVGWDEAEELKRKADPMAYGDEEQAARIIAGHLAPFIEEIRGSLDYFQVQHGRDGLRRVVLTGAGSRVVGLPERLGVLLGVPVVQGHVLQRLTIGKLGTPEADLAAAEDLLSVAVGLGLDGQSGGATDQALNLLPPEILHKRADRRQKTMAAAAAGFLALALLGVWFLKHSEASSTASIAAQTEKSNANLKAHLTPEAAPAGGATSTAARYKIAAQATKNEVDWPIVLTEIANHMPSNVWLTSFQGNGATAKTAPSVAVNAQGRDYTAPSGWVSSMSQSGLVSGLWVSSTSAASQAGTVTFTSTFQLKPTAATARQATYADQASGKTAKPVAGTPPKTAPAKSQPSTTTTTTTAPPSSTTTSTSPIPAVGEAQKTVGDTNSEQSALESSAAGQ